MTAGQGNCGAFPEDRRYNSFGRASPELSCQSRQYIPGFYRKTRRYESGGSPALRLSALGFRQHLMSEVAGKLFF